jgi:tRNA(His) 5'-end guanylyltransferase
MKFDDLDDKMRVFETAHDVCVLPGIYMAARIDGRSFSRLTKDVHQFAAPFDERFRDHMVSTVRHLMSCGFSVIYGYTESDEISLLFSFNEDAFSRKHRKYNSILASEAASAFTLRLGAQAAFDCRLCELPNRELVIDYFRWRAADAHRNALNAHCYWRLREDGKAKQQATRRLEGMSTAEKNELLFSYGINFNDLPVWQKRGIGLYWVWKDKSGRNPKTEEKTVTQRRVIHVDMKLPMKEEYESFLVQLLERDSEPLRLP